MTPSQPWGVFYQSPSFKVEKNVFYIKVFRGNLWNQIFGNMFISFQKQI